MKCILNPTITQGLWTEDLAIAVYMAYKDMDFINGLIH